MIIVLGIIIFIIGCCLSSYEENTYKTQRREEQRYKELMQVLNESKRNNEIPIKRKQTRRRFAIDKEGNLLGEEISEEMVEI